MPDDPSPVICSRCSRLLTPGNGDFYEVTIEAVADPSPPNLEAIDLAEHSMKGEINALVREMEDLSAQEAMDQIHRKMTIQFCRPCYRVWIEDPGGSLN